jgi:intracellular septation protein
MKSLLELMPVALFFIVYQLDGRSVSLSGWEYQFDGIYSATAVLMVATVLQIALARILSGKLEKRELLLAAVVCAFGGATLALRNELFIQWKPTIFNWSLAAIFIGSYLWSGKTVMERAMGSQLTLPQLAWRRLNQLWISNFVIVGALNLIVAYRLQRSHMGQLQTLQRDRLHPVAQRTHGDADHAAPPSGQ